jgi:hypothetical protein
MNQQASLSADDLRTLSEDELQTATGGANALLVLRMGVPVEPFVRQQIPTGFQTPAEKILLRGIPVPELMSGVFG